MHTKNIFKGMLAMLTAFVLMILLVSCGGGEKDPCTEHKDEDGDKICDVCKETIEDNGGEGDNGGTEVGEVVIFDGEEMKAQFVVNMSDSLCRKELNDLKKLLDEFDVEMTIVNDDNKSLDKFEYEVLIGEVTSRGEEYHYDPHTLGPDGTVVKIINKKVIITGGSEDARIDAVKDFIKNVIGVTSKTETLNKITVTADDCYEKATDPKSYRWSSVSIGDADMKGSVIVADISNIDIKKLAESLQSMFYTNAGYWMEIKNIKKVETMPEKAIVIEVTDEVKKDGGFSAKVSGSQIVFKTCFVNKLTDCVNEFTSTNLLLKKGDVKINSKLSYTKELRYIRYEDPEFGATGNGRTNDFEAIKKAHDYANKYGHIVKASGKYYISDTSNQSIKIQTDTDWTGAEFIIDDSNIAPDDPQIKKYIFVVASDYSAYVHKSTSELVQKINEAGGIDKDKVNAALKFFDYKKDYPIMLTPYDEDHKVYIRYGGNANDGSSQHELIVLDEEGNMDPTAPFLLDYNKVDYIYEYRLDDTPITVQGGTFTTKANQAPCAYTYYNRGIEVCRSNTLVYNIVHKIVGEGPTGAPYGGFIDASDACNILVKECVFQAHRAYQDTASYGSMMGTYEIGSGNVNNIRYLNCTQSNFCDPNGVPTSTWYDENGNTGKQNVNTTATSGIWGVHGSSYSKNIIFDGCTLNRIDAHAGAYNMSVINGSKIKNLNFVGGGIALVENSTVYNGTLATLRSDYGSTWNGDIIIRNSVWAPDKESAARTLITGEWVNHYFGYPTHLPNVYINNLTLEDTTTKAVSVFGDFGLTGIDPTGDTVISGGVSVENENPFVIHGKIYIQNSDTINFRITPTAGAATQSGLEKLVKIVYEKWDEE